MLKMYIMVNKQLLSNSQIAVQAVHAAADYMDEYG